VKNYIPKSLSGIFMQHSFLFSTIILDVINASDKGHIVSGPEGHDKNQVFYIYVQCLADCAAV
jgi:hypothetical protein